MDLSRLACKILERVRDFRSNFSWVATDPPRKKTARKKTAKTPTQTAAKATKPTDKVYHRQPTKPPKRSPSKVKTSRGKAKVKK